MPIVITYVRRYTPPTRPRLVLFGKPAQRHKPLGSRAPLADNFWGSLIRLLREEQRISRANLCLRCGIQPRTLRKYEEGRALPYIDVIERILNELGYVLEALSNESITERYHREHMVLRSYSEISRYRIRV